MDYILSLLGKKGMRIGSQSRGASNLMVVSSARRNGDKDKSLPRQER